MYISEKVIHALEDATSVLSTLCGHEYDYAESCDILAEFTGKARIENLKRKRRKRIIKEFEKQKELNGLFGD